MKNKQEERELSEYIDRASQLSPEQILMYLGRMRDFLYKCMTPEGRKYFESQRENKLEEKSK